MGVLLSVGRIAIPLLLLANLLCNDNNNNKQIRRFHCRWWLLPNMNAVNHEVFFGTNSTERCNNSSRSAEQVEAAVDTQLLSMDFSVMTVIPHAHSVLMPQWHDELP